VSLFTYVPHPLNFPDFQSGTKAILLAVPQSKYSDCFEKTTHEYLFISKRGFYFIAMKSKRAPKRKPIDPLLAQLGARIRQLRKKEGFTSYEDFANDRELPASQYGRYEKGQNMRYTSLVKVAGLFGMTLKEFFSDGFD
jgi:hypothetical protein